jgi:hypothetical protein
MESEAKEAEFFIGNNIEIIFESALEVNWRRGKLQK